jgi:electron transfer flavoprotein beta subunit
MHLVVCVKQVPNPEAAFSMLKVDEHAKKVVPASGLQLVMSPFDEQAVEAALRMREDIGQAKITAVSVGPASARDVLKHTLAMGADEAVLVRDDALDEATSEVAALALARAIRSLGTADLVLTGRQAADWDAGIVGCGIAELLGLPVVTFVRKLDVNGRAVRLERVLADGVETIEADLPVVVTISNELGAARKPTLRETMRAARKPLTVKTAADIGLTPLDIEQVSARRRRERLFVPLKSGQCEIITGGDEVAQALQLAERLRTARLI